MKYPIIAVLWISCGIIGAGFDNAYFQRRYSSICESRHDHAMAVTGGIVGGPLYGAIAFMFSGYGEYGWSLAVHANPKCEK